MLHAFADALEVVDDVLALGRGGPNRQRPAECCALQVLEQRLLDAERHHGDAFDIALDHAADGACHELDRTEEVRSRIRVHRNRFEDLNELGEKRVGDFRNDQAENAAAPETRARAWVFG